MSIAEGIGSFLAGAADRLTGGWFSGPERDEQRSVRQGEIERQNYWNEQGKNQLQTNIDIAKRNNIDPLAVLGSNVGSVATTPVQQPTSHHQPDFSGMAQILSTQIMADVEREKTKQLEALGKIKEAQTSQAPQFVPNTIPLPPKLGVDQTGSTYLTFATMPDGGLVPVPSKSVKELIEDSPQEFEHYARIMGHNYLGSDTFSPGNGYEFSLTKNAWYKKGTLPSETTDDYSGFKAKAKNLWQNFTRGNDFRTNEQYPIGKKMPASLFRNGINPNMTELKSHGIWQFDKKTNSYILKRRR